MRSLYLIHYRMRGGKLSTLPVYAADLSAALVTFHRRMGSFGCEHDQYRVASTERIQESAIRWKRHRHLVLLLSAGERQELLEDRKARQLAELGRTDRTTLNLLEEYQLT